MTAHSRALPTRRSAAWFAAITAVAFLVTYVLGVRNTNGQIAENALLEASTFAFAVPAPLGLITPATVLIVAGLIGLLSLATRGWPGTLVQAAAVALPVFGSQLLKYRWLERPDLLNLDDGNTFPSGHATVVAALVFALVLATPRGWRWLSALLGGALLSWVSWQLLAYGWHRPSDVIGGIMLAACAAALGALLMPGGRPDGAARTGRWLVGFGLVIGAIALISLVLALLDPDRSGPMILLAGQLACVCTAVLAGAGVAALPVRPRHRQARAGEPSLR